MFPRLFARLSDTHQLKGSMGWLLRRADDRLLQDIGLTRAELEALMRDPPALPAAAAPAKAAMIYPQP